MKQIILFCFLMLCLTSYAQEKWQAHISIGQYPASLVVPSFKPIHLGIQGGLSYQWNNKERFKIIQCANLGYFYHKDLQKAVQLFTEFGFQFRIREKFFFSPFNIGGGYVLSINDLSTLEWNSTTNQYEVNNFATRNNWMISTGASLAYLSGLSFKEKPITFFLDYRLQIQGIIVEENVPLLAYAPLKLGVSIGLK